jgi:hypothetical protein
MAYVDKASFCILDEFKRYEANRVDEHSFKADELYMVMFKLNHERHEAAKLPARVLAVTPEVGLVAVKMAFLDSDLQEHFTNGTRVQNGYLYDLPRNMSVVHEESGSHIEIARAYCRDYYEDMYDTVLVEQNKISVGV